MHVEEHQWNRKGYKYKTSSDTMDTAPSFLANFQRRKLKRCEKESFYQEG